MAKATTNEAPTNAALLAASQAYWGATREYVSTDGKFKFNLSALPFVTLLNAVTLKFDHVFGNEALAKASEAKRKAGGVLSDKDRDAIILAARETYLKDMRAAEWGHKSGGGVKMPSANRLEEIRNGFLAVETVKALTQKGIKAGTDADTWINPKDQKAYGLAYWADKYLKAPQPATDPKFKTLGEQRGAELDVRAKTKFEAEKAEQEAKKAAKAREAAAALAANGNAVDDNI
jgi:hypothetical protein